MGSKESESQRITKDPGPLRSGGAKGNSGKGERHLQLVAQVQVLAPYLIPSGLRQTPYPPKASAPPLAPGEKEGHLCRRAGLTM